MLKKERGIRLKPKSMPTTHSFIKQTKMWAWTWWGGWLDVSCKAGRWQSEYSSTYGEEALRQDRSMKRILTRASMRVHISTAKLTEQSWHLSNGAVINRSPQWLCRIETKKIVLQLSRAWWRDRVLMNKLLLELQSLLQTSQFCSSSARLTQTKGFRKLFNVVWKNLAN